MAEIEAIINFRPSLLLIHFLRLLIGFPVSYYLQMSTEFILFTLSDICIVPSATGKLIGEQTICYIRQVMFES